MTTVREKSTKVAITARSEQEASMLHHAARSCGFEQTQIFNNPRDTVEVAKRNQFQLFITQHDFSDMTGLTMMQTLRSTGNYGLEPHLFLLNNLTPEIMLVLVDQNVNHVLTLPFSADRVQQKLLNLWQEETNLTPAEEQFREAHAAMSAGLLDMAQEIALKTLRTHGPTEKLLLLLGDVQTQRDRPQDARRYYDAAQKYNPKSSAAAHKMAQTYMQEKDFERAAELMNELTRLNPLNLELLANAGLSNYEISNMPEARALMEQLQSLDCERQDASEILARIAIHEGDPAKALAQLQATHDLKDLIQVFNNEGVRLSKANDTKSAIALLQETIRLIGVHPQLYALYFNLGVAYLKQQEMEPARQWLEKSLQAKPDFEKARQTLERLTSRTA